MGSPLTEWVGAEEKSVRPFEYCDREGRGLPHGRCLCEWGFSNRVVLAVVMRCEVELNTSYPEERGKPSG